MENGLPGKESLLNPWRTFIFGITLVIIVAALLASAGILSTSSSLIEQSLYLRAKAHFRDIVLTRRWNAMYGGVYVEKLPGVESNPYLPNPDITSVDGKVYTKKNPALMTREISELAAKDGDYQYHITSLKLRNPNNAPDEWERLALESFEKGTLEQTVRQESGGQVIYRYMAPLKVEESCLQCHSDQGYQVGDVRGGISVRFDVTQIDRDIRRFRVVTAGMVLAALILVLGAIFAFVRGLYQKLDATQKQLRELAEIDSLTHIYNRRYFFQALAHEVALARRYQDPLSCIMLDADRFKRINDTYDHTVGDRVLEMIGRVMKSCLRQADIPARYGGEEFVALLPHTDLQGARSAAEKLRREIAATPVLTHQGEVYVTVSLGVAQLDLSEEQHALEGLLQRADRAMYQAKSAGRNNVQG